MKKNYLMREARFNSKTMKDSMYDPTKHGFPSLKRPDVDFM